MPGQNPETPWFLKGPGPEAQRILDEAEMARGSKHMDTMGQDSLKDMQSEKLYEDDGSRSLTLHTGYDKREMRIVALDLAVKYWAPRNEGLGFDNIRMNVGEIFATANKFLEYIGE